MIEERGDLFSAATLARFTAVVIPTNGEVNKHGRAVMGAGVALMAAKRWSTLPIQLGSAINSSGNRVRALGRVEVATDLFRWDRLTRIGEPGYCWIVAAPTKEDWRKPSTTDLIRQSAAELSRLADQMVMLRTSGRGTPQRTLLALPRLGCGLGGLEWANVGPILARCLDDRFVVLTP